MMGSTKFQADYMDKSYTGLRKVSSSPNRMSRSCGYGSSVFSEKPSFVRPRSPANKPGMVSLLMGGSPARYLVKKHMRHHSASPSRDTNTEEAIKMSSYPNGQEPKENEPPPIERDDWPAPPSPAVLIPQRSQPPSELTEGGERQQQQLRERRISQGKPEISEGDSSWDLRPPVDEKLNKELDEISKLCDSPMAKVIRNELTEEVEARQKKVLDPRSASRVPAANKEPLTPQRFTSSVNASPSRSVDRPKVVPDTSSPYSKKADGRSSPAFFSIRPSGNLSQSAPRASTLPPGTPGAYVYEAFMDGDDDEEEDDSAFVSRPGFSRLDRKAMSLSTNGDVSDFTRGHRLYKSSASAHERLHAVSDSRENNSVEESLSKRTSSIYDGTPFTSAAVLDLHRRSYRSLTNQNRDPAKTYSYNELRLDSKNRPKGLREEKLEIYLCDEEFEEVLGYTREEFRCLPRFKQCDEKKKVKLF